MKFFVAIFRASELYQPCSWSECCKHTITSKHAAKIPRSAHQTKWHCFMCRTEENLVECEVQSVSCALQYCEHKITKSRSSLKIVNC